MIENFARLDDFDIIASLKMWSTSSDYVLSFLSRSILDRKLFKTELQNEPFSNKNIEEIQLRVATHLPPNTDINYLVFTGTESNQTYNNIKDEIKILSKNQTVNSITEIMDYELHSKIVTKHYLCYPKYF